MHKTFAILKSKNKNMDVENIIRKIKLGNFIINMDLKIILLILVILVLMYLRNMCFFLILVG